MCSRCGKSVSCSSSWKVAFTPGVATALAPVRPHSAMSFSAWRGSASYSMCPLHHRITLFRARPSFSSCLPGPKRGPMLVSYSALTACSNQSSEVAGPLEVKSSPCTEQVMWRFSW